MSDFEFPSFPQPTDDARALLARLYREIGVSAVAAALDAGRGPETPRAADRPELLTATGAQTRAA